MYCRKCGKEVAETSAFCPNCGERIGKEATAKKKIQISRKTCIVTALLVTMVLVSVVVYLNVIKKGEIHIESYQEYLDGELWCEYEIDSEEKKVLSQYYGGNVVSWETETTYCINNNEIEALVDHEKWQCKATIRFETENKGKTAYIVYYDQEGDADREQKVCWTEDNVVTFYEYYDGEETCWCEFKIAEGRVIGKTEVSDFTDTCEIEENKLKLLSEETSYYGIYTATDKIEGDDDIAELLFEHIILAEISF